jgi:ABC-type phosphate/phosphonate transport system substrate-binding protein
MTISAVLVLSLLLASCGSGGQTVLPTLPPTSTPLPRSTPLPTVGTQVPLGSTERPFLIALVPPKDSTATGTSLGTFLSERTGMTFKVDVYTSYGDVLTSLCGETPTFAWVDGLTLLAAQAQGCAAPALKFRRGTGSDATTGVRVEIVGRAATRIAALTGLKDRPLCRLNSQDVVSWILPLAMLRGAGVNPPNISNVKDYPDTQSMLQAVVDNQCAAAAIPAGTLTQYTVNDRANPSGDITKSFNVIATSPELPYGGLMVSTTVPSDTVTQVVKLLVDNPSELKDLIAADEVTSTSASDYGEIEKLLETGGINLRTLGR